MELLFNFSDWSQPPSQAIFGSSNGEWNALQAQDNWILAGGMAHDGAMTVELWSLVQDIPRSPPSKDFCLTTVLKGT